MKNIIPFILLLFPFSIFLTSCEKDDPIIVEEEEVITTLTYTLTPNGGGTPVILSFSDPDGDGGNEPVITDGTLAINQIYTGTLQLLNEAEDPTEEITEEIEEEDEEHQFFFQTSLSDLTISYEDQDADGNPVGLNTTVSTGEAGSGTITITLRHEPNKSAAGVSEGDITNAGGETDIEVTFNVNVE